MYLVSAVDGQRFLLVSHTSTLDPNCRMFLFLHPCNLFILVFLLIATSCEVISQLIVCFHVLTIVSSARVKAEVHVSCQIIVLSRYIPGMRLVGHVVIYFKKLKNPHTILYNDCAIYIPIKQWVGGRSIVSTPSPAFICLQTF